MSYQVIFTDTLYHHGIKGQRWGIRRFRNRDGTLTNAGKRHYDNENSKKPKKKSYHRVTLEMRYMDAGMSKKEAEQAADKKIKIEKGVAIAAGATALTVAAVAAYKKIGKEYCDRTIKKGETINTLAADPDRVKNISGQHNNHFYAAINKKDKQKYQGLFGITRDPNTGKAVGKYNINSRALDDIKIASPQNAKKEFVKVYKQNPSGYERYLKEVTKNGNHEAVRQARRILSKADSGKKLTDKDIGKLYNAYNVALPLGNRPKDLDASLFKALKEKGYSGVIDVNDLRYSRSLLSKSPTIIFDKSNLSIEGKETARRLSDAALEKQGSRELTKLALRRPGTKAVGAAALVGAGKALSEEYDERIIEEQKRRKEK